MRQLKSAGHVDISLLVIVLINHTNKHKTLGLVPTVVSKHFTLVNIFTWAGIGRCESFSRATPAGGIVPSRRVLSQRLVEPAVCSLPRLAVAPLSSCNSINQSSCCSPFYRLVIVLINHTKACTVLQPDNVLSGNQTMCCVATRQCALLQPENVLRRNQTMCCLATRSYAGWQPDNVLCGNQPMCCVAISQQPANQPASPANHPSSQPSQPTSHPAQPTQPASPANPTNPPTSHQPTHPTSRRQVRGSVCMRGRCGEMPLLPRFDLIMSIEHGIRTCFAGHSHWPPTETPLPLLGPARGSGMPVPLRQGCDQSIMWNR